MLNAVSIYDIIYAVEQDLKGNGKESRL